jgi:small subunit ribosomal protein S18
MTSKKNKARQPRETNKKIKKKTSVLVTDKVEYIDYKDVNLLQRFVSDRSKIRGRRVNGNDVQQQREITNAIKNAREMAIMPYTKRVSQTRAGRPPRDGERDRGERGERGPRRDEAAATEVSAELDTTLIEDGIETEEAEG